jgi:hypothetical protein
VRRAAKRAKQMEKKRRSMFHISYNLFFYSSTLFYTFQTPLSVFVHFTVITYLQKVQRNC